MFTPVHLLIVSILFVPLLSFTSDQEKPEKNNEMTYSRKIIRKKRENGIEHIIVKEKYSYKHTRVSRLWDIEWTGSASTTLLDNTYEAYVEGRNATTNLTSKESQAVFWKFLTKFHRAQQRRLAGNNPNELPKKI